MQNSLLFYGIGEHAEKLLNRSFHEDTEQVIKQFMEREIAFEGADSLDPYVIKFERVYRLGRPRYDQNGRLIRPRPIVAAFANFKERESVRRSSGSIKDKAYSVREQFPAEIEERRKILNPFLKSAKSCPYTDARMIRDKLVINGTTYTHKYVVETTGDTYRDTDADTGSRPPFPPQPPTPPGPYNSWTMRNSQNFGIRPPPTSYWARRYNKNAAGLRTPFPHQP